MTRLIAAEILKLRRRRGLLSLAALLAVGGILAMFGVRVLQHAQDPASYGPAGGLRTFENATDFLGLLAMVVGTMIGATAGAAELEEGIFRDLVATGRPRNHLFLARLPGAMAITLPLMSLAFACAAAGSVAFGGALPVPDAATIAQGFASVLAATATSTVLAVGVGAALGSRGPTLGVLLAFELAVSQVLLQVTFFGDLRTIVPINAVGRLAGAAHERVAMGVGAAIAALAAWMIASTLAGLWAMRVREI
jgi:ABC-type transport system involved in multi-copper enzyme maturation permease subunit